MTNYVELRGCGLKISAIGVGTWQWGSRSWGYQREYGEKDLRKAFEKALEENMNFFDTAEMYGGGLSEDLLGKFMEGRREDVIIATKLWPTRMTGKMMWKALERSLQRLKTSYVDLYQLHWPNPVISISKYVREMERMLIEGKIRASGVCNVSLKQLIEARSSLSHADIASVQVKYNMLERRVEKDLLPYCIKEGIALIAYSPLAQGLLTGKYGVGKRPKDVIRRVNKLFTNEYLRSISHLLDTLARIAEKRGKSIVQVALNWLIGKPMVVAIPGVKKAAHVEEAAGAMDWRLSEGELAEIEAAWRKVKPNKVKMLIQGISLLLKP